MGNKKKEEQKKPYGSLRRAAACRTQSFSVALAEQHEHTNHATPHYHSTLRHSRTEAKHFEGLTRNIKNSV
jgi:hypothetical protein